MTPDIARLKSIKDMSDARRYRQKADALRAMVAEDPSKFRIDSEVGDMVGITHEPTGFRFHIPKHVVAFEALKSAAYRQGFESVIRFRRSGRGDNF